MALYINGKPAWVAQVVDGIWTTSGTWTIPAVTLGGDVVGTSRTISALILTGSGNDFFIRADNVASPNAIRFYTWATADTTDRYTELMRLSGGTAPNIQFFTPNETDPSTDTLRFWISGGVATAEATCINLTWTGIVLSGALDAAANYVSFTEMAAPGAGAANTAKVYAVVGGDTLTDLAAVFQDGTVAIFAQEATDPDSPIFQFPDATDLKLTMRKPDRKTIQFVAQFPDGREFVMSELRYPTER